MKTVISLENGVIIENDNTKSTEGAGIIVMGVLVAAVVSAALIGEGAKRIDKKKLEKKISNLTDEQKAELKEAIELVKEIVTIFVSNCNRINKVFSSYFSNKKYFFNHTPIYMNIDSKHCQSFVEEIANGVEKLYVNHKKEVNFNNHYSGKYSLKTDEINEDDHKFIKNMICDLFNNSLDSLKKDKRNDIKSLDYNNIEITNIDKSGKYKFTYELWIDDEEIYNKGLEYYEYHINSFSLVKIK